ncbi:Proteasome component (PCI) domain protein [Ascosphaera apis ARSEF 7405]|uniref:Eukaryotic translation initiation factor 3 subunit M n=1 Tax=Ascosphaera apis ARSEF 7405 TaxID=392613 RepID=A0A166NJF8_9EURO|nr:Proteasome component (PCI) domain protein [Ascosphaera apis ARSEF 7405]
MAAHTRTLLVEGAFSELADEFTQYIDVLRKTQESGSLRADLTPAIEKLRDHEQTGGEDSADVVAQKDAILKKIVDASFVLNSAPEKELIASYNLLIALITSSPNKNTYVTQICGYLAKPLTAAPQHGSALALSILSTIFNTLPRTDAGRYPVFLAVLAVIRQTQAGLAFDALKTQLKSQLPTWIKEWDLTPQNTQKLHIAIADAARDSGDVELSYNHLLLALQAIPAPEASSAEAREIATRALLSALTLPFVFDFGPLTDSDAIQSLRSTDASLFELLEIFAADTLDTYEEFLSTTPLSSIHDLASSSEVLVTKMRLLTLASLAASTQSRSLPYDTIAGALRVPREEVEKWVIDTIRAGLVEGKLSQLKGEFLVQRATYRVFGEKQWAEVQGRLMVWRRSLENVLGVIRNEKEKFVHDALNAQNGGEGRERRRYGQKREQQQGQQGQQQSQGSEQQQQQQQQPKAVEASAE